MHVLDIRNIVGKRKGLSKLCGLKNLKILLFLKINFYPKNMLLGCVKSFPFDYDSLRAEVMSLSCLWCLLSLNYLMPLRVTLGTNHGLFLLNWKWKQKVFLSARESVILWRDHGSGKQETWVLCPNFFMSVSCDGLRLITQPHWGQSVSLKNEKTG